MPREYIVLDIETTGLDVGASAIIEVGALLISGGEIKAKYSSFVRYEGKLPETTKRITGITDAMLSSAPSLETVKKELREFVQKRAVIAHNGFSFDFRILERDGVKFDEKYDSMEFAFFVLPTSMTGHGTAALSERFDLGAVPHRALADCELEFAIVQRLQENWKGKNKKRTAALKYLAERTGWWWTQFLTGKSEEISDVSSLIEPHVPYRKKNAEQNKLSLGTRPVELAEVEKFFAPGSNTLEYSEDRPEQREMACFVANAFNGKQHAVVEAGTGVGKSKAYLVPSVLFALKNDIPVVISTYTKALQDQLAFKEIKHVRDTIKPDLRVAVVKGKQNYVCLDKFREFSRDALTELSQRSLYEHAENETRFTTRLGLLLLSSWILETERGDWDELPYWLAERMPKRIMQEVCNLDEMCAKDVCELFDETKCYYAKARLRAKDADLVIMNHAILLTGIRRKVVHREESIESEEENAPEVSYTHPLLPTEAKFVVFDEAHHLEDAATSAWTLTLSQSLLERLLHQLYDERKGVRKIMDAIIGSSSDARLPDLGVTFDGIEKDLRLDIRTLFKEILEKIIPPDPAVKWDIKLSFAELSQTPERLKPLSQTLDSIEERLAQIKRILLDFSQRTTVEKWSRTLSIRADLTERLERTIGKIIGGGDYHVRYIERSNSLVQIHAAPLSIANEMKELVYDNFNSVTMTSATITVDDKFNFFAHRCGTDLVDRNRVKYLQRPSSFDFSRQAQFFVPRGISYSSGREAKKKHAQQCLEFLKDAIVASQGGALVLCSSHEQVGYLYDGLLEHLSNNNIWLLRQSKDMGVTSVVRDFASDINSVLIGTATLWQGVDVPGPSLRSLFIYKIPYKVFTEPLIQARREQVAREGRDSYSTYYEPLTALDLKQGFGRLIRKKTDMGIAVLLDDGIMKKDLLLKSFPPGVVIRPADQKQICDALAELAKMVDVKDAEEPFV